MGHRYTLFLMTPFPPLITKKTLWMMAGAFLSLRALVAADRPNVLWIVSEDNSYQWIRCYGNPQAQTPRIDALAKDGILFERAYSNAPVCAVARSTLLMGMYAVTMGTQHMRSRYPIPERYRPYVEYLRHAGYYCTNNAKTDYNIAGNDNAWWDESSAKAHYSHRPAGAPFFAVFNILLTHESQLFAHQPGPKRLAPADIQLPPYVPDLPEMRSDFARYHDRVTAMDKRVGELVDELAKAGLADDTIVIYNSDHGGVTPRGKRYLEETGVRVPLVVRVPAKWRHLVPFAPGSRVDEPVSFVDFLPTFLSLTGITIPDYLQGRAFLGSQRKEPAKDEMEFLFADRFDEVYGLRRGLTNGRWKYLRRFTPLLPAAPYSFYAYGVPSWAAWEKAWKDGKLSGYHRDIWESRHDTEELYDLTQDPWEMHNLAHDANYRDKLLALRSRLQTTMGAAHDAGIVPEPLFGLLRGKGALADVLQSSSFGYDRVLEIAFAASQRDLQQLPKLQAALTADNPVTRYWAICGFSILGKSAADQSGLLEPLLKDPVSVNRSAAAFALWHLGRTDLAKTSLLAAVPTTTSWDLLYLLNTLKALDLVKDLPPGWEQGKTGDGGNTDYIRRFSDRLATTAAKEN